MNRIGLSFRSFRTSDIGLKRGGGAGVSDIMSDIGLNFYQKKKYVGQDNMNINMSMNINMNMNMNINMNMNMNMI